MCDSDDAIMIRMTGQLRCCLQWCYDLCQRMSNAHTVDCWRRTDVPVRQLTTTPRLSVKAGTDTERTVERLYLTTVEQLPAHQNTVMVTFWPL